MNTYRVCHFDLSGAVVKTEEFTSLIKARRVAKSWCFAEFDEGTRIAIYINSDPFALDAWKISDNQRIIRDFGALKSPFIK